MIRVVGVCVLASLMVACASKPSFNEQRDSAPKNPRDVSAVKDAVPAPVRRTIAGNKSPYTVLGKTYTLLPESRGYKEQGLASWYGQKFHGRNTSNGEVYDMYAMTAAHKTLPIPSYVKVTNLDNGRSIVVRVNDRGPFHADRIIDLSYAGAVKLDFLNRGTARVEVEDVTPSVVTNLSYLRASPLPELNNPKAAADATDQTSAYLQLGAFSSRSGANYLSDQLAGVVDLPIIIVSTNGLYRVMAGPLNTQTIEANTQRVLVDSGFDAGYVVNLSAEQLSQ